MAMPAGIAATFLMTAAGCGLLTLAWIHFARSLRIEDQPGQRRLHDSPTPRGGGIAIALVLVAAIAWIAKGIPPGPNLPGLAAGIGLFAAMGLLDDLLPIPAIGKFALQLIAAAVLVVSVSSGWALNWLVLLCLIVACCYVVNIWNFMDGSNGLIAVQALLIALAMAFWPGQADSLRLAAIALAGACTGFLPFNLPKARVFLGDVGSHALGAAAFGLLLLAWHAGSISLLESLLVGTVLLLDSGLTLARRLLAGRKVWRAHREHLYQYAVRRGHSHARVCLFYAASTAVMILLAAVSNEIRSTMVTFALFIVSWMLATLVYVGLRLHWLKPGTHREREA